ncbi:MAG: NAD-glutamate dehydrogenase domain-containing protein, partial [Acidimicrobiales bacterium]
VERLEDLGDDELHTSVTQLPGAAPEDFRFKLYRSGGPLSLSDILPVLKDLGVVVLDEFPYEIRAEDRPPAWIYDFGIRMPRGLKLEPTDRRRFEHAFEAVWSGRVESDSLASLVLSASLGWRDVALMRTYRQYLHQIGTPFSHDYIDEVLTRNSSIVARIVELFGSRFDPDHLDPDREVVIEAELEEALADVASLDEDRILRSFRALVEATVRTNHYQTGPAGEPAAYTVLKLDSGRVPDVPAPVPHREIFVKAPHVEGVHLRMGRVARGGLRASDRRDDFRTEVLGLVKAQAVKNAVIVPVGAKGGFVARQLPASGDRAAVQAEVVRAYRTFIEGMLDVTDNLVGGEVVPPDRVIRYDGDDPYLVVAADKGTATFSDIANEIACERGFWLGDAFASGGSNGYDHKAMGITARGAWDSVRRHFRELGVDIDTETITAVGVGDMSGDVFGNGMLLSRHLKLVAAFDHRHVFIDPDPDPAVSYDERRRLFELPRSSWDDYDRTLISEGGGVFSRAAKSIELSEQMRTVLDVSAEVITPTELISAVLAAPVDLLWNGGVGTYVKSAQESHADAADRANDALRIDAHQLRCRVVGEGGNLGFTQLGRIEFARLGGRVNNDAIDNSAGVDCSDHEVNLKILLDGLVVTGDLTTKQRNELLQEMTDEVAELVLADNYAQNLTLAGARIQAPGMVDVHVRHMAWLERNAGLVRE